MKPIIKKILRENLTEIIDKTIVCDNCGWKWKESTSEPHDLYVCHKCGHDNETKYLTETPIKQELIDVEDDELYNSLESQAEELRKNSEISFGSAEPFEVIYNKENGELIGATWIETSGAFSPHIIIKPKYRNKGLSNGLIDGVVEKYKKMKQIRGDYKFILNIVNPYLVKKMEQQYGFKIVDKDKNGNITMGL